MLCEDEGLGVVCDGMGGHQAGEVASRLAADLFADRVTDAHPKLIRGGRKLSQRRALAQELVVECTHEANELIFEEGQRRRDVDDDSIKSRMGTTLALVLVLEEFAVVANVGDSRVYRVRRGGIEQLSEDHVIVAEKKRHPADPRPPRMRKYVTRALGTREHVDPQVRLVDLEPNDLFVVCSDGLTDVVTDEEIAETAQRCQPDYRAALKQLIRLANKRGGPDNVTVVIAEVVADLEEEDDDTDELERQV
ncbi:MAG: PP2C family serine/threonine-protein phosphatase [Planctomycetota bacterium]